MMGWLGTALARAGYLVIAVDHPGNNGADPMTLPGSVLSWLRADDLRAALAAVQADPVLGAHVDRSRLGVVGFSAGGYTALLAAAGGRHAHHGSAPGRRDLPCTGPLDLPL
ncbi:hypothetical protein G6F61_014151 [Rhizopus arrhizus]|nr:hypothetical protein G6F68_017448 [Rhizopus microsporus]KAG1361735.1 hypothetical protein G6F61_014151 [Rhizopus arrhizus]